MGCRFCASTLLGLSRNLYPSEMLDQIYAIQKATGERVSHWLLWEQENLLITLSLYAG